jgi:hypothetical protein
MSGTSIPDATAKAADDPSNKRVFIRWPFKGTGFPCRMGRKKFEIRLKDLSCGGAAGLMEEPVAVGDFIMIQFDDRHVVEAEVCWVRRVMVGVSFATPLPAPFVSRVYDRAAAEIVEEDIGYRVPPKRG